MSDPPRQSVIMSAMEPKTPAPHRVVLEPMLQVQLIGRDPRACIRMAQTYYRWAKQLYLKLQIEHPEELAKAGRPSPRIRIRIRQASSPRLEKRS